MVDIALETIGVKLRRSSCQVEDRTYSMCVCVCVCVCVRVFVCV
jgi:hypothetical protein